jgi:SAM-dependent methyltransferase
MVGIIFFIAFIILLSYAYAAHSAAPWIPCRADDVQRIIALAEVEPGQKIFEVGCGDGRILFAAAKRGALATGCEISLLPYLIAQIRRIITRNNNPKIFYKNLWNVPLHEFDLVIVFLTPRIMEKLRVKLERELKPGARVLCYVFPMRAWQARLVSKPQNRFGVYLYER